ncbi:MAG: DUF4239 domain-containing protein [Candidatus Obscuribacter phosphatis]|uniref:DUF4239 domain-containing protein n=1 Tax=Candidatus Obscuribacter phosphatis TaxID=1906157 RepID=A0A8J7PGN7_9BACT|nr:DUF4239 domain-containing protein [Candidatus Obscuribacter phosphatis]
MNLDSYLSGAALILGVSLSSVAGLLLVRKYFHLDKLKQCHEVGGYLLSVVGTMYAVLLGLVVVDAMTKFQNARAVVETEANSLADVFLLAEKLPQPKANAIRGLCHAYATEVIEREWPAMSKGEIDREARRDVVILMKEVISFEPVNENQKAIYPIIVQEACQVWDNRRARTNLATYGVPPVEWFVLILGGIVTVVFTYFFAIESLAAQVVMTSMVSLLISLNLYLVVLFGAPFSGDLQVGADALKVDKLIFENQLGLKTDDSNNHS